MSGAGGSGNATGLAAHDFRRDDSGKFKIKPLPKPLQNRVARHGNVASAAAISAADKGLEIEGAADGRGERVLRSTEEEEEVGEFSQYASVSSVDSSIPVVRTLLATPLLIETDVHRPVSRHELVSWVSGTDPTTLGRKRARAHPGLTKLARPKQTETTPTLRCRSKPLLFLHTPISSTETRRP